MQSRAASVSLRRISFSLLFLMACGAMVITASAQSGRKQKKPYPEPPPQGVKMPEEKKDAPATGTSESDAPPPEEKDKPKEPTFKFLVGTDSMDMNIPMWASTVIRDGCTRELRRNPVNQVSEINQMTRSGAVDAAKKDEVFAVLIEVVADRMGTSNDGVEVRFAVFEPKSGRQVFSGIGFPVQQAGPLGLPPIGANNTQYRLELMGRDVGRQVMSKLNAGPKGKFPLRD